MRDERWTTGRPWRGREESKEVRISEISYEDHVAVTDTGHKGVEPSGSASTSTMTYESGRGRVPWHVHTSAGCVNGITGRAIQLNSQQDSPWVCYALLRTAAWLIHFETTRRISPSRQETLMITKIDFELNLHFPTSIYHFHQVSPSGCNCNLFVPISRTNSLCKHVFV
jgi:hypothetical protein